MTGSRKELVKSLSRLLPVLPQNPLQPALKSIYFDGGWATVSNDILAMRVPCDLPVLGGIAGREFLTLLASSGAEEVVLTPSSNGEIEFKLGRTKAKFACVDPELSTFKRPTTRGAQFVLSDALVQGLELALISTTASPLDSSRKGVTFAFGERDLTLYSTDEVTAVRAEISGVPAGLSGQALILSEDFCRLLLKLDQPKVVVTDDGDVVAVSTTTKECLYGRVYRGAAPEKFASVFGSRLTAALVWSEIPPRLRSCLERAASVSGGLTKFVYSASSQELSLTTEAAGCVVSDKLRADLGDADLCVRTYARYILRCLDYVGWVCFTQRFVALDKEGAACVLVSVSASND